MAKIAQSDHDLAVSKLGNEELAEVALELAGNSKTTLPDIIEAIAFDLANGYTVSGAVRKWNDVLQSVK